MTRLARIVLKGARLSEELDPITLDVLLDDKGHLSQKYPTSGWWGKLRGGSDLLPFIFYPSGKMDFGTEYDPEDRYHQTNLPTKKVDLGEYISVSDGDGDSEHCFVVKQVLWADELTYPD